MNYKAQQATKQSMIGKIIVGIDPGKRSQQLCVTNRQGIAVFTFRIDDTYKGYHVVRSIRCWPALRSGDRVSADNLATSSHRSHR